MNKIFTILKIEFHDIIFPPAYAYVYVPVMVPRVLHPKIVFIE